MAEGRNVFHFKDVRPGFDPTLAHNLSKQSKSIIIIDNGSYHCRTGWTHSDSFNESSTRAKGLVYKNVIARTRKEKGKEAELHVANDIVNIEAVRFNLKTPFDKNVVTQFDHQATLFDYGFYHLGISSRSCIPHPVVLTEPLGNPSTCRAAMSELLFDCYSVPRLAYGVDCLFSLYQNQDSLGIGNTSLVVSFGFHCVHVVPVLQGRMDAAGVRRINVGGFHLTNFLHRVLQLKYPAHVNSITIGRAEEIIYDHCYVAKDYMSELRRWAESQFYEENVHKMQLPFSPAQKAPIVDPEVVRQRRQEMAKRLTEMNSRKREEKLQEDESLLKTLISANHLYEQGYDDKVRRMLSKHSLAVKSQHELGQLITSTRTRIEKAKLAVSKRKKEEPSVKKEEAASEPKKRREDMDDEEKKTFDSWLDNIRQKRHELISRRSARQNRRKQLAKRRTAASQERMRMISQLAKHTKKDDTFGMRDEDWDVYKKISKDGGDSDSDDEQEKLAEYEAVLKEHDPSFGAGDDLGGSADPIHHDTAEWYQLHLSTERIRVPEILFQPSIVGHEQAGVSETIEFILGKYSPEQQESLTHNVFLCGSLAKLPGLKARLEADLCAMRPFKSTFRVLTAGNPTMDAWNGARKFALDHRHDASVFFTKEDCERNGADFFKQHSCSNSYFKMPDIAVVEQAHAHVSQ